MWSANGSRDSDSDRHQQILSSAVDDKVKLIQTDQKGEVLLVDD